MRTNTIKTIKSFKTKSEIVIYLKSINYPKNGCEIINQINEKALIKYGSILVLFDPFNLLEL